jgi:hypothetical protein
MTVKTEDDVFSAIINAKKILKKGDRFRASICGGSKPIYIFECWFGLGISSKSGVMDIAAADIDRLNGLPVNFSLPRCSDSEIEALKRELPKPKLIYNKHPVDVGKSPVPF